jgi:hypothetical protein
MLERDYQPKLIKKLERMFPGCVILKNDARYLQGIPDLVIFHGARYAFLEVKAKADYVPEPNQPYYVELLDSMSFAAFIYPENEREVLGALRAAFQGVSIPPST